MKYFGSTNSSVSKVAEKDGTGSNGVATAKFIFTTEQHTFYKRKDNSEIVRGNDATTPTIGCNG